jgi:hypothetical protein
MNSVWNTFYIFLITTAVEVQNIEVILDKLESVLAKVLYLFKLTIKVQNY